jgi:hypothetical protein
MGFGSFTGSDVIHGALQYPISCSETEHYYGQNRLAQSLNEKAYVHDPDFRKADIDERQVLYSRLAEQIWDPDLLFADLT